MDFTTVAECLNEIIRSLCVVLSKVDVQPLLLFCFFGHVVNYKQKGITQYIFWGLKNPPKRAQLLFWQFFSNYKTNECTVG